MGTKLTYEELEKEVTHLKELLSDKEKVQKDYHRLINNISDTIWEIDLETLKFIYVNPSYEHISGFSDKEIKNNRLEELFTPESFKLITEALSKELIADKSGLAKPRLLELKHFHKNGSLFWAEVSARFVRDSEGRPCSITGVTRDITKRKNLEKKLIESEKRYRSFVENFHGIVYRGKINTWKPVFLHGSVEEITGYNAEDFISGKLNWFDIILQDDLHILKGKDEILSVPGYTVEREYRVRNKNGKITWVYEYIQNTCNESENLEFVEGVIYDITKLKETMEKLETNEALLKEESQNLNEVNTALKILLQKRDEDKYELENNVVKNTKILLEPYIAKLKNTKLNHNQETMLIIIENNLNEIVSPFIKQLSSKLTPLSPSEIQVVNLIKYGKTNKEIAGILGVAKRTIEFHRENIRKKLGLKNKKTNLKTYLMTTQ